MWMWLLCAAVLLLCYLVLSDERLPGIPSPPRWPLLGNMPNMSHNKLLDWAKLYGSVYKVWMFGQEVLVVTGTEAIKEACQRRAEQFDGRPNTFRYRYISLNFSDLVFTSGCERVRWMRQFVDRHLPQQAGGHVEDITHDIVHGLVRKFGKMGSAAFNPVPILTDTGLQIMHVIMFHEKLSFHSREFIMLREINHLLVESVAPTGDGVILDRLPWLRFIYSKTFSKCQKALKMYDALYARWKNRCMKEQEVGGVVRQLIKIMKEGRSCENQESMALTDANVLTLVMNIMVAGNMNLSSLLSSLLNILVHYPAVQEKLHQELAEVVGDSDVTMSDEVHMTYTQATVLELLRFAHPVPYGVQRKTTCGTTLCGYPIPRNTTVLINLWGHHHDSSLWEDPFVFRPERFLNPSTGQLLPATHPCRINLLPFGVGGRMCVGARLGLQYLFLLTATVLQRFTVLPADTDLTQPSADPRHMQVGIVMMPQDYTIKLQPRRPLSATQISSSSTSVSTGEW